MESSGHDSSLVQDQDIDPDFPMVIAEDEQFAWEKLGEMRRSLKFGTIPLILIRHNSP
jgi:hypothetical protein